MIVVLKIKIGAPLPFKGTGGAKLSTQMRLRLNCIVLGGMVALGVVVICINYYEMRELRKAVESNARVATITKGVGVKSSGYYVWIHPENVSTW